MSYFRVAVNAGSEKERAGRIKELESRGFEVVKTFERENEHKSWGGSRDPIGNESIFKYDGSETTKHYGALMQKSNVEYLAQKAKEREAR